MISRVILTGYRLADGVEIDCFFTSGLGWTSRPDDTPANTFFIPRLRSPLSHAVEAWDGDRLGGVVRSSLGAIELGNEDGALSYLLHDYAFAGRAVLVFLCDEGQVQADLSPFWSGLIERVDASDDGIEIRVANRHKLFEVDLYQSTYAGDNVAPEGIEGDESLQDKPKPVALGICRNVSPVLVNSQKLIYQVHWRSIEALDAVYDKGVALGAGSNYADAAALQAASPTPGTYDTCLAEGLLRLGSSPVGQITADVRGDNVGGYVDSPAGLVTRLLEDYALLDEPVDTSAVAGISWPLGLYAAQEATVGQALDQLLYGLGIFIELAESGAVLRRIAEPVATAVATFDERLYTSCQYGSGTLPPFSIKTNYQRNWSPGIEPAGAVSDARRGWLEEEWRTATAEDAAIKDVWPTSQELAFDTALDSRTHADAVAVWALDFFQTPRRFCEVRVAPERAAGLALGDTVAVSCSRLGLVDARFVISGIEYDIKNNDVTLALYG